MPFLTHADITIHESEFLESHAVIVPGPSGALLIDAGITEAELLAIAAHLADTGQTAAAAFSTHPHWDHMLWHESLGTPPRYVTARGAAVVADKLSDANTKDQVEEMLPEEIAGRVPLDLMGDVTGLPVGATVIPWDGPEVRIFEHRGHADGHAALLLVDARVLVVGDMLSDVLIPMLENDSADPIAEYLHGLDVIESVVADADLLVPGHGSLARGGDMQARIDLDRAYVVALRDGTTPVDPRLGPDAPNWWVNDMHEGQVATFAG